MADLQDFHETEERREKIQDAILKLQTMTPDEHHAQDQKIVAAYHQLVVLAGNLILDKAQGKEQGIEEDKQFVQLEAAINDIRGYLAISQTARMNRIMGYSNNIYYEVKKLAKEGNKQAEAAYLKLKKLKEEQLKSELGESDN